MSSGACQEELKFLISLALGRRDRIDYQDLDVAVTEVKRMLASLISKFNADRHTA